jgi:hypothetical protein
VRLVHQADGAELTRGAELARVQMQKLFGDGGDHRPDRDIVEDAAHHDINDEPAADRVGRIETHAIDVIPESERPGRPRSLFAVWAASDITDLCLVLGGTMVLLGLDVWQALGVVVAGNLFWMLVGWLSISGPSSGTPSEVVTRAVFGVRGNRIYNVVLGWGVGVAYEAINLSIGALAGFALVERWGGHANTAVNLAVVLPLSPSPSASTATPPSSGSAVGSHSDCWCACWYWVTKCCGTRTGASGHRRIWPCTDRRLGRRRRWVHRHRVESAAAR